MELSTITSAVSKKHLGPWQAGAQGLCLSGLPAGCCKSRESSWCTAKGTKTPCKGWNVCWIKGFQYVGKVWLNPKRKRRAVDSARTLWVSVGRENLIARTAQEVTQVMDCISVGLGALRLLLAWWEIKTAQECKP